MTACTVHAKSLPSVWISIYSETGPTRYSGFCPACIARKSKALRLFWLKISKPGNPFCEGNYKITPVLYTERISLQIVRNSQTKDSVTALLYRKRFCSAAHYCLESRSVTCKQVCVAASSRPFAPPKADWLAEFAELNRGR